MWRADVGGGGALGAAEKMAGKVMGDSGQQGRGREVGDDWFNDRSTRD